MKEQLLIRLGSQHQDKIHWLIWSGQENEIIASGELSGADELVTLSEKSMQREVVVLVPGCDTAIKSLMVPGKSQKAVKLAAPYMLEDELAQDVDELFFAYASQKSDIEDHNCFLVAVERTQMQLWLQWLADASIKAKSMLPEVLLMPLKDNGTSIVRLDQQLVVRTGPWQGFVVDLAFCSEIVKSLQTSSDSDQGQVIYSYSPLPEQLADLAVENQPEELPLAIYAMQLTNTKFNLLQGEFQINEKRSPVLIHWSRVAVVAGVALLLSFAMKGAQLMQINQQQKAVEQEIISVYKKAFPQTKRVRVSTIKSQLKSKLQQVGSADSESGFLPMLTKVQPAFVKVPELKPESIKFDAKRQELRMQASANDYQAFDKFKNEIEKMNLTVNQGAQRNQGDSVSGSLSITAKGGR